jgi:hypothetical protein
MSDSAKPDRERYVTWARREAYPMEGTPERPVTIPDGVIPSMGPKKLMKIHGKVQLKVLHSDPSPLIPDVWYLVAEGIGDGGYLVAHGPDIDVLVGYAIARFGAVAISVPLNPDDAA